MKPKPANEPTQRTLFQLDVELASSANIKPAFSLSDIFLGTSSFTAAGWQGSFYPMGMRSKDFLRHYASQFQAVEIDSTFYGTPATSTVTSWNEKTPGDFREPLTKRCADLSVDDIGSGMGPQCLLYSNYKVD